MGNTFTDGRDAVSSHLSTTGFVIANDKLRIGPLICNGVRVSMVFVTLMTDQALPERSLYFLPFSMPGVHYQSSYM